MEISTLLEKALECGFSYCTELDIATMNPMQEVRDMCAADKCHAYNKNWSCPPACGTVEECAAEIKTYKQGIIVQSTIELEDEFDIEAYMEIGERHANAGIAMLKWLKGNYDGKVLGLNAGMCKFCKECTFPDAPCRFPEMRMHPLEGFGIFVSDLCTKNNIPYNRGKGTMTYVGAFLVG
ncbi:MAG: DUF2284 domain-containing protein [Oscillospiraceae bacterium]|nr:DUF2284 domain-containing protein [Oscillospiraceae bacterium]